MKSEIKTHTIYFKKDGDVDYKVQGACGKSDLFACIREMMKDGFTEFKILTLKN